MTLAKHWKRAAQPKVNVRSYSDLVGLEMTPERVYLARLRNARVWSQDALASVLQRQLRTRGEDGWSWRRCRCAGCVALRHYYASI